MKNQKTRDPAGVSCLSYRPRGATVYLQLAGKYLDSIGLVAPAAQTQVT